MRQEKETLMKEDQAWGGCTLILTEDLGWVEEWRDSSSLCLEKVNDFIKFVAIPQDTKKGILCLFLFLCGQRTTVGFSNARFHMAYK